MLQIASREHLLAAILTTLLLSIQPPSSPSSTSPEPTLVTRSHNLHSEVLLTLSPSNNISDSIRRHGLSDNTTDLVVVRFGKARSDGAMEADDTSSQLIKDEERIWKGIEAVVKGKLAGLDELDDPQRPDWKALDKVG